MSFALGDAFGDVPVRTAGFDLPDRRIYWAEARLYLDRLVLSGWYLWGRYHRSIALDRIARADVTNRHLVLHLADDSSVRLRIANPEYWATAIPVYRDVREE